MPPHRGRGAPRHRRSAVTRPSPPQRVLRELAVEDRALDLADQERADGCVVWDGRMPRLARPPCPAPRAVLFRKGDGPREVRVGVRPGVAWRSHVKE